MRKLALIGFLCMVTACGSVETVPDSRDDPSKSFIVENGKANIYIVQDGGYFPGFNTVQIYLNGQPLGALSARTFHVVSVAPGTYNVVGASPENQESVKIQVEAGSNNFVGLRSRIGWTTMQVTVLGLKESEGRQSVLGANRAKGLLP